MWNLFFFFEWDVDYFCFGYFGIFDVVDKGWVGDYYVVVLFQDVFEGEVSSFVCICGDYYVVYININVVEFFIVFGDGFFKFRDVCVGGVMSVVFINCFFGGFFYDFGCVKIWFVDVE